jgi:hypothetical protein
MARFARRMGWFPSFFLTGTEGGISGIGIFLRIPRRSKLADLTQAILNTPATQSSDHNPAPTFDFMHSVDFLSSVVQFYRIFHALIP